MTDLVHTPAELRAALRALSPAPLGLVPTMGALHEGHAHLIRRARLDRQRVVLSVFVNPLQFGPNEDYAAYPRTLEHDLRLAEAEGVDLVFAPSAEQMYPPGYATRVSVPGVSEGFDGASRPGHFTGVATVVLKLLNLVQPQRAYFGEKDWQQLMVIRHLARDLNLPLEIVGVSTVRSDQPGEEGLALSSRNSYFTPEQRRRASVLARSLQAAQARYAAGERQASALLSAARVVLDSEPELSLDYLSLVDGDMHEIERIDNEGVSTLHLSEYRLLVAARLFGVRLIDNMPLLSTGETR
ncbi:pantoate--beta-alanine ligase [Deinococcus irradiatisoli]|uniref:pantoate--beta-alanine ligase n=1 Tax=Deinococcus irradiatisoli TaxID=2202254 RepID=UPI001FE5A090|nr:pantoate--beta-alanine ligase [Deinococcus irradiatisoli]